MRKSFNLTTHSDDIRRFADQADFEAFMEGFDGVELLYMGPDRAGIIPTGKVLGLHLSFPSYWLDFWRQDEPALRQEFGSLAAAAAYYGGDDPQLLCEHLQEELRIARQYGAEYLVFHGADCSVAEAFTQSYRHSDAEVIDGVCDLLNQAFGAEDGPWLLVENLWHSGFRFTEPQLTQRLLSGLRYPKKGIMLDTGHLAHTNRQLRRPEEAAAYIRQRLAEHGELCRYIKGVHLNLSLTGAYAESVMAAPPRLAADYPTRCGQLFRHIFQQDQHQPFLCPKVAELIRDIDPSYLTYEFITESRRQQQEYLSAQRQVLSGLY